MIFQWNLEQYLTWLEWPVIYFLIAFCYGVLAFCFWAMAVIFAKVFCVVYFYLTGRVP